DSPSIKCPHGLFGLSSVYCSNTCVASAYFPAWYAASPSAYETGPASFGGVTSSGLSPAGLFRETGSAFAERCVSWSVVCDVLSVEQPAAIAATSRAAVIFPLRVIWPPLCSRPLYRGRSDASQ